MFIFSNSLGKQDSINYIYQLIYCVILIEIWKVYLVPKLLGTFWPIESVESLFAHILYFWIQNTKKTMSRFVLYAATEF